MKFTGSLRENLIVAALTLLLTLVGTELFLRFLNPEVDQFYIWPPGYEAVFDPGDAFSTPGVEGPGRFEINSLGLRGDERPQDTELDLFVFGGSTAVEIYLDQDEIWSQQIGARLNAVETNPRVWVGLLARSSMATLHNALMFEHLVPQLPQPDLILNLVGVNDMQLALRTSYLPDMTAEDHMNWTFAQRPSQKSFLESLAITRFYRRIKAWQDKAEIGVVETFGADGRVSWRKCRQSAPEEKLVRAVPDLHSELAAYEERIIQLADAGSEYGAPTIFLTQPTLWADNMSAEALAQLHTGGIGPSSDWCTKQEYYAPGTLAVSMRMFNKRLLETCKKANLVCYDLARDVPKEARYFYDDMHFSEAGATLVAELVTTEIMRLNTRGELDLAKLSGDQP